MRNSRTWDEQMSNMVTHRYGAMLRVEALRDTLTSDMTTWQLTAWRHTTQSYSKHSNRQQHQATLWQGDKCHCNKVTSDSQRSKTDLQQWHGDRMTRNSVTSDMEKQLHVAKVTIGFLSTYVKHRNLTDETGKCSHETSNTASLTQESRNRQPWMQGENVSASVYYDEGWV